MKPIITNEGNATQIQAALDAVNGNAVSFTTHNYADILRLADRLKMKVASFPKCDRCGATLIHIGAGPSSAAYRNAAIATKVTLRFASDGMTVKLVDVERVEVYPTNPEKISFNLTQKAYDAWISRCAVRFGVIAPPSSLVKSA
jgi:hypothetical protein